MPPSASEPRKLETRIDAARLRLKLSLHRLCYRQGRSLLTYYTGASLSRSWVRAPRAAYEGDEFELATPQLQHRARGMAALAQRCQAVSGDAATQPARIVSINSLDKLDAAGALGRASPGTLERASRLH